MPYKAYRSGNALFLASTPIHIKEFENQFGPYEQGEHLDLLISATIQVKLSCLIESLKFLSNPGPLFKLYKLNISSWLFHGLTFSYELCNARLLEKSLNSYLIKLNKKPKRLYCFELGYCGHVISNLCQKQGLTSGFIQHGFIDNMLYPVPFNNYYLWNKWDIDFFIGVAPNAKYRTTYDEHCFPPPQPASDSKIIFFALEYPSNLLRSNFIDQTISQLIENLKNTGWKLVLRPHPRFSKNKDFSVYTNYSHVTIDPYRMLPIEESFSKNNATIFITMNSASIIKIRSMGVICFYFNTALSQTILAPLNQIATEVSDAKDLTDHIQKL